MNRKRYHIFIYVVVACYKAWTFRWASIYNKEIRQINEWSSEEAWVRRTRGKVVIFYRLDYLFPVQRAERLREGRGTAHMISDEGKSYLGRRRPPTADPESIDRFIEIRLCRRHMIWLLSYPLLPSPVNKLSLFPSLPVCFRSVEHTGGRGGGAGGGEGAKSYDCEKDWSSINNSVLSELTPFSNSRGKGASPFWNLYYQNSQNMRGQSALAEKLPAFPLSKSFICVFLLLTGSVCHMFRE
jgi:hypothetical protein